MRGKRRSPLLRVFEWTLLVVGVVCASWYGWTMFEIHRLQAEARRSIERMVAERSEGVNLDTALPPADARLMGQIDIPSVRLSAVVLAGDDDGALALSVGYLPDTPPPWHAGNSAFAAHRDGLFRPLEHVRGGDAIWLTTRHGDFQYRVLRTLIVSSKDTWVLDALPGVNLTLITCFPFTYIGHAPNRFIVQAEKVRQAER
jgi:sortase A